MKIETIFISKSDIKRCKQFAKKRMEDVSLYQKRGGFKEVDILSGAMAECAVYNLLKSRGVAVSKPDFTIHAKGQKSYDADLTDGVHHFHVKGQTLESKERYGASWIMQRKDPILVKPQRMHYLVPCTVNHELGRVEIYGIMSIKTLVDNHLINECKVPRFRTTKVALYLENIKAILGSKALWGALVKIPIRYNKWKEQEQNEN